MLGAWADEAMEEELPSITVHMHAEDEEALQPVHAKATFGSGTITAFHSELEKPLLRESARQPLARGAANRYA